MVEPGKPLERFNDAAREPHTGEVLIEIAGCGLCHTDLGFLEGGVSTRGDLPLVLGHEIAGTVIEAGDGAERWLGMDVLVPAVIPCEECLMCLSGRGNVCTNQKMPGNDFDGGFATHVTLPARGLAPVVDLPPRYELADLCVVADAVTTPLQAVRRAGVAEGDFVVVVGTGGVGGFAVQVAAASGATVIAVDIDDNHLEPLLEYGAAGTVNARGLTARDVRGVVRDHA
ncbi:MAG: alcohol dehydrogenase catalytic domain-containing protein, partial [Acidimicrobiia bacterium]